MALYSFTRLTLAVYLIHFRHLSTSAPLLSLAAHVPEGPSRIPAIITSDIPIKGGSPIPCDGNSYWNLLPSIHSANFWAKLEELLRSLHNDSDQLFSVIIQPQIANGSRHTLSSSFLTNITPNMEELHLKLDQLIEKFESQSGDGLGPLTDSTYIRVTNVTNLRFSKSHNMIL